MAVATKQKKPKGSQTKTSQLSKHNTRIGTHTATHHIGTPPTRAGTSRTAGSQARTSNAPHPPARSRGPPESHRSGRRRRSNAVPHHRSNAGAERPASAGNCCPSPPPTSSSSPALRARGAGGDGREAVQHAGLACSPYAPWQAVRRRRLPAACSPRGPDAARALWSRVVSFWGGSVRSRGLCSVRDVGREPVMACGSSARQLIGTMPQ